MRDRDLESAGFTKIQKTVIAPRLVISVEGPGKVGKTTFALSSDRAPCQMTGRVLFTSLPIKLCFVGGCFLFSFSYNAVFVMSGRINGVEL